MMNNKVSFTNSNNPTISLSAVIYFPPKFDETRQYPAIVVSHPGGGVKEQTAGTYAEKLAEKGFVTIAYDASYQGESGGEPRQLENPYIRTEDVSAVIDYLTTLSYVDNTRIGAMGICAGAGYTANAAIQDRRIKAIGTVSAVNIGSMFRNGWENNVKSIDALPHIEAGSNARTSDISSEEYAIMPLAPMKEADAPNEELRQAWEYYHTPRAQYPTAPGYATLRSLNQIITYDAYHMAEVYLTQPMQIVAGGPGGG
ncbi:alpha/beta hydrolase, partial [Shigella flexneri]|uniref:alpha/beta hydrolase n=2 Tax=Shigella flexneri TaxID=623 RepID=UPI0020912420